MQDTGAAGLFACMKWARCPQEAWSPWAAVNVEAVLAAAEWTVQKQHHSCLTFAKMATNIHVGHEMVGRRTRNRVSVQHNRSRLSAGEKYYALAAPACRECCHARPRGAAGSWAALAPIPVRRTRPWSGMAEFNIYDESISAKVFSSPIACPRSTHDFIWLIK